MKSQLQHLRSIALACLAGWSMTACVDAPAEDGSEDDVTFTDQVHSMPWRDPSAPHIFSAPAGAKLNYYGGKVIQNVKVVQVLYGSGTYIPQLTSNTAPSMASSYSQMVSSGVYDWLNEYNTSSPAQTLGRGSFLQSIQIAPASARNGTTIADASVQAELNAQIAAGTLPAPDDNVIYMVHFPKGKTNTSPDGAKSCVSGGFCAYHGTFKIGSQNVYYGVMPDVTGGCATGCGSSTAFGNQQSIASHELIEAVTDAEVGLATVVGPPLAWYDTTNGEIGDICNGQQGTFVGTDGQTYTIQKEFSNQQKDCITTRAVSTTPDFTVGASPASATIAPGASTTFAVTTTAVNGSSQSVALSIAGLPSGVTGSFSPATVTAGGSSTLTVAASTTATGSSTFTITGTAGSTTHTATGSITVATVGGNTLSNNVPVTGISGAKSSLTYYKITVPAGQTSLVVQTSGGTGDADLYVRKGSNPTTTTYDCRPYKNGNAETCTITSPAAADYYIMLRGYAAYAGLTLVAHYP
ncbi:MAG: PPC domain-containing protein [Deltaproteobacteria bacterium]|nr:PPC domain-containing protein [Deltaproteobacteria bacterium]